MSILEDDAKITRRDMSHLIANGCEVDLFLLRTTI